MTDHSDAEFTGRVLTGLPAVLPSPGLETALLASYDAWRAQRRLGVLATLTGAARGFADLVWPGAPVWAPASAFAAALLLGVSVGAILPAAGDQRMGFSLDRTPGFTLLSSDMEENL